MMKSMLLVVFALFSSLAFSSECHIPRRVPYCSRPAALVYSYEMALQMMGGNSPIPFNVFFSRGCGTTTDTGMKNVKIIESKVFSANLQGIIRDVNLVKVFFNSSLTHEVDSYDADGSYQGKKKQTFTSGWLLKKDVICE